jgi:hypothetical protein
MFRASAPESGPKTGHPGEMWYAFDMFWKPIERGLNYVSICVAALVTGMLLSACEGPGVCAIQRVYGVRVTILGGADPEPSSAGGAGGSEGSAGGEGGEGGAGEGGAGEGGAGEGGVCLATAQATDGSYTETLECEADSLDCVCVGLSEIPGTFDIRVRLGNREETQTVRVRPEGCSVSTKQLTFFDD